MILWISEERFKWSLVLIWNMPWSFLVWQISSFLSELIGLFQWMAARMRCTEILKLIRNIEQNWETITLLVLPFPDIWHLSGTWCNFFSFFFKKTLIKLLPENSSHLGWDKTSYPLRSWCYHFFSAWPRKMHFFRCVQSTPLPLNVLNETKSKAELSSAWEKPWQSIDSFLPWNRVPYHSVCGSVEKKTLQVIALSDEGPELINKTGTMFSAISSLLNNI